MTLDDWNTSSDSSESSIKTRKQIRNVQLDEKFWDNLVTTYPGMMYAAAMRTDESSAKAIVKKIDQAIEDDIDGHTVSDDMVDELEQMREDIVQDLEL